MNTTWLWLAQISKNVSGYELEALFTWSRQMEPVEAGLIPTGELRFCISKRLRSQWDIQIDPSSLEFRFLRPGR